LDYLKNISIGRVGLRGIPGCSPVAVQSGLPPSIDDEVLFTLFSRAHNLDPGSVPPGSRNDEIGSPGMMDQVMEPLHHPAEGF